MKRYLIAILLFTTAVLTKAVNLQWQSAEGCRWAALSIQPNTKDGFSELSPNQTGIVFTNSLPEERYLTNQILLNGSGVAAGDVDGDGLCDLFFCGIDRPSVLYHNEGNWKFTDITAKAGVSCAGQASSGAAFADVNGDRQIDLLVNGIGTGTRLFLNDGGGKFHEATAAWGLRGGMGSSSMALADIDGDGRLDLYVANYRITTFRDELEAKFKAAVTNGQYSIIAVNGRPVTEPDLAGRYMVDPVMGILENGEADVLYRNDSHGKFIPMSWTDGSFLDEDGKPISVPYDWGLSVMFRDLNGDNAPDIYVCNDFHPPDRIWINDGRGQFKAVRRFALRHTSIFSMGVDFADIDRDGDDDIFVADMLSRRHTYRQLQLMDRRPVQLPVGLIDDRPQYSRNMLLLNQGDGVYGEIAQYAGVEASEWCWCPVFIDVDLDGYEDLLQVTGHLRDAQNIDISRQIEAQIRARRMSKLEQLKLRRLFTKLEIPNLVFRNRGNLTFEEMGKTWGFDSLKVSQGIALADLDNDGDADVIINCLDDGPLVLRNNSAKPRIAVRLRGISPNTAGIGARIIVRQAGLPEQSQEVICGGRYVSSDDPLRVFAAKSSGDITLEVRWRSGHRSIMTQAKANRIYEIDEVASKPFKPEPPEKIPAMFTDMSKALNHHHMDKIFDDYHRQPLLPHKLSQLGPGVCWFDINGDGWEDLIVGTGQGGRMAVLHNDGKGAFTPSNEPIFGKTLARDQTAVLGWAIEQGKDVLLAGLASYEDGQINKTNGPAAIIYDLATKSIADSLPGQIASTGPMALADMDGDGCMELFLGGRANPGRFPEATSGMIFRWQSGKFVVDPKASKALYQIGMVSGAVWSDLDGNGFPELIVACEGGPLRIFRYDTGQLREITESLGLNAFMGLWNSVSTGDFDNDGRMDIVAGNWGSNTRYQSQMSQPIHFYHGDLDDDGIMEVVEAYYDLELQKIVPWRDWDVISSAMPFIKEKYPSFTPFSTAGVSEFLGERMAEMKDMTVNTLACMVFLNRGGHFDAKSLPLAANLSPLFGIAVADIDGDGNEDIVGCQNIFQVPPLVSRLDGGRGILLKGDGKGGFTSVPNQNSGLAIYGEGRGMALCDYDHDGRTDIAVAQNGNATQLYRNAGGKPGLRVQIQGPAGNLHGIGAIIRLQYRDGRLGPAREVHAGSGYWSQDSSTQVLGINGEIQSVHLQYPGGKIVKMAVSQGSKSVIIREAN